MPQPTLKTIALAVGVSVNTVSLALRNSRRISEKTRNRIHKEAQQQGYHPNPYVSTLMQTVRKSRQLPKSASLAFVGEFKIEYCEQAHPYMYRFFHGAWKRAEEQGYGVNYLVHGDRPEQRQQVNRIIRSRGIQGVLATWISPERPPLDLEWEHFSSVIIGFGKTTAEVDRVENDQLHGTELAVERLVESGHHRIGMVFGWHEAHRPLFERYSMAFRQALFRLGIPDHGAVFCPEKYSIGKFREWLRRFRPDGVLSLHSQRMRDLEKCGLRVPEDVSFGCLDLTDKDLKDRVSGIRYRNEQVGEAACNLLIGMIQRNFRGIPHPPTLTTLPGYWVEGTSILQRG
jgi:LacI family transcriptional regulator